ncbi:helix-turn-helix domain-containing protein [Cytophagales bacterium LB-30]|uniref:Helix-turn-helix domain-containing protein n=1 Tax=Shiella aurantiaca TaxID=3058365 RepID=A0ABT8F6L6_9BACT|nr:helix-turn-helix domain-containing protein [Shiella aurantiaca]MDN4166090.1 helix-turn-helix domain-containing protein [Shiella aurantiaca]
MQSASFTLSEAIILSGVGYGAYMAFMLFRTSKQLTHNGFLALLMLAFALLNWRIVLITSSFDDAWPSLLKYSVVTVTAIFPALYGYIRSITQAGKPWKPWLHFIPFFLHLLFQGVRFLPSSWRGEDAHSSFFVIASGVLTATVLLQMIGYSWAMLQLITGFEQRLKQQYSEVHERSLQWFKQLLGSIAGIFLFWLIVWSIAKVTELRIADFSLLFIAISVVVYWIGTQGLSKGMLYLSLPEELPQGVQISEEERERAEALVAKIRRDKLYLQPQLQVAEVAEAYELNAREVSYLLNKGLGQSFYQVINTLRVEEVCERILQDENSHFSFLGIALESGFHSKSVFNKCFKEVTGLTPKEYKKMHGKKS